MGVQSSILSMMGSVGAMAGLGELGEAPKVPANMSTSLEMKQWTMQRVAKLKQAKQAILGKTYDFNDPIQVDLAGIALENKIKQMKENN